MLISVVIHTLNSDGTIRRCLESVKGFDEIIVCDMYSSDNTLAIAREYGARIVMHDPCGIVEPARAFAIGHASGDWALVIDSDEVVPPDLEDYLYLVLSQPNPADGLLLPRKNYFMDRFMRSSFPDYQLRFFRKDKFTGWPATIHSRPHINGRLGKAPARKSLSIIHLDKNRVSDVVSKTLRYAEHETEHKSKRDNIGLLILKPAYRFVKMYILKGGFLDGRAGFVYAALSMFCRFLVLSKGIEDKTLSAKTKLQL
ncbi:MAG: glycosyltransferase family 2 protein [Tannerellaceae bacterium]|jgi:glycosyltransferase involved in cell wall biosynthesis|nr:glycosyltransferase family 2 protein [Tannerellaceae bacterium]